MDDGSRWPLAGLFKSLKKTNDDKKAMQEVEDEIISMVDEAHEQGVLELNEAEMIQNIFAFNDTKAGDIMTHRKNVIAFDIDDLLKDVIDRMMEEDNSRYPVYEEDLDNIRGLIHYKDAVGFLLKNPWAEFKSLKELPGLIRKAALVPETGSIAKLFRSMQAKQAHMAVVVDEYGQTCGIVTMEDILEEIVGEILDEYDEEEVYIHTLPDSSIQIDGRADLEEVAKRLNISFEDAEMDTLSGYLTGILGHIPTPSDIGHKITAKGYCFQILSLGNRTIGMVRAVKTIEDKEEIKGDIETCQDIQNSLT